MKKHVCSSLIRLCLVLTFVGVQNRVFAQGATLAQLPALPKKTPVYTEPVSATQSLKEVLKQLENRYGIRFTYNEKTVEGVQILVPDGAAADLNRLLTNLLRPIGLGYKRYRKPNTIYYIYSLSEQRTPQKTVPVLENESSAPRFSGQPEQPGTPVGNALSLNHQSVSPPVEFAVQGVVRSETNEGLPGVSVVLKGTTSGTVTDADGRFSLTVPDGTATLVFSYIGYIRQEVAINNRSTVNVALVPDTKALDEVVVVGYGTQKKSEITSAITSVKAAELLQTPATNLAQGLQGLVSGLQVTQNNAAPGGAISMRIRGTNSINGSSEPLYIIDGVQVQNASQNIPINTNGGRQIIGGNANETSPLSNLNPNDIESVEVLKDASAAAIYGSQAANGVVIITTKRGKSGKTKVSYESYFGQQSITKTIPVLNGSQFAELENEVYKNPARFPNTDSIGTGTNWQELIFRKAKIQNHQLTVSGGNEKTQLLVSFNYFNQDGIVINSSFDRYSLRLNLDHQATPWLKIGTSTLLAKSINQRIPTGSVDTDGGGLLNSLVGLALATPPVLRPYDEGRILNFDRQLRGLYQDLRHPLQFTKILDQQHTNTIVPNVYLDFSLLKGLKYRANFNAVVTSSLLDYYFPIAAFTITDISANGGGGGFAMKQNQNYNRMMHESILSYDRVFNTSHTVRATAGYSYIVNNSNYNYATGQRFASDATTNESIGLAQVRDARSSRSRDELVSFFGRLSYNFKGKYFIDLNARMDGSSKFGRNNKFALFPALSAAWNVTGEDFLENSAVISNLKLRASAGQTGNQGAIGAYQSLATVGIGRDYIFNGVNVTGTQPTGVANPDLKWEKSTQVNVGLDLDVLKNKISFVFDAYSKRTDDLIFARNLPLSSGYATVFGNFASLQNRGLEFAVKARPITTDHLKWDVSGNISFNRNEIIRLQENLQKFDVNFYNSLVVGQPIGLFRTYVFEGIYQNGESILEGSGSRVGGVKVKDVNGDGRISDSDLVLTNSSPDFTYGFSTNLKFKGFYLNALFSGVQGNKVLNLAAYQLENPLGMRNVLSGLANRWTPENPSQEYVHAGTNLSQRIPLTDRYIEDGSFLRARNLTVGYQLPRIKDVSNAKIYLSGNNLFTVTGYSGFDPEVNSFGGSNTLVGVDNIVYPVAKSYLLGLQVEF
ncbi:TonB-dependent receptor [Larkinella ripae]